jgi:hypothetical protein
MASYKFNMATIRGCPSPQEMEKLLKAYGMPEGDEFGVLEHQATAESATANIVRRTMQVYQALDPQTLQVNSRQIEKVTLIPFAVLPKKEMLEIYAGSASAIKDVALFLSGSLALSVVVEEIELDVIAAIEKLAGATQKFQLRSVRVSDFAHNSYMIGPYSPKFADSEHGKDFMDQYAEAVTTASVKFQGPHGRVTVQLKPTACFGYSCQEEDRQTVRAILRNLA